MLFWSTISISPSQYWSLTSFVIWWMMSSHEMLKNVQRTLGANLSGFLMLHIFEHISIGPLVFWPDWMPLNEFDCHWMWLNVLEYALSACEHLWASNSAHECLWVSIERSWMCMSVHSRLAFEWVWTWLNAFFTDSYMKMSARECLWEV